MTATGRAETADALKQLGADVVIDYTHTDLYAAGHQSDAILDAADRMKFAQAKPILKEHGEFCTMTPTAETVAGQVGSLLGTRKEKNVFAVGGPKEMEEVLAMAAAGQLKPIVGQTFPMVDAKAVIAQFESGKIKVVGKVVLVAA